jgi:hypothetical protein
VGTQAQGPVLRELSGPNGGDLISITVIAYFLLTPLRVALKAISGRAE